MNRRTLLITGAATGMGHEIARRALARGDRVIATTLRGEAHGLGEHENLSVLVLDVGDDASVSAAFAETDSLLAGTPLDCVVNCAGISPSGALEVARSEGSRVGQEGGSTCRSGWAA